MKEKDWLRKNWLKALVPLILFFGVIVAFVFIDNADNIAEKRQEYDIDQQEEQSRTSPDKTCADAGLNSDCEKFISLWYEYHSSRLGISKEDMDKMTSIEEISVNNTAYKGMAVFTVRYFVQYGEDISILTHDNFPLSIPPDSAFSHENIDIPRDGSMLTYKDIKDMGEPWEMSLTDFPLGPLAYETKESVRNDVQKNYLGGADRGSVNKVTFTLNFNRGDVPVASLSGSDRNRENCYQGEHDLMTKKGGIHWSGPCKIF